jgi:beta-glucanase (GH16 family)
MKSLSLFLIGAALSASLAQAQNAAPEVVIPINPTIKPLHGDVPQSITSPLGRKMVLKFDDEFDAVPDYADGQPYIDRTKWQTTFWQGSSQRCLFGNGEAQYYVDKYYKGKGNIKPEQVINPFSFEKPGILTISATKVPQELWDNYWMGEQRPFASGLLITDAHFKYKYGYAEGRFKLPNNRGAWPAFWLLGVDPSKQTQDEQHNWPPEIDIFEFFGHRPTKHSAGIIAAKGEELPWKFGFNEPGFDITQDFHTWGLEWDENDIVLTFDGKIWARSKTTPSLRIPMYLLVNLAVGGNWYSQEMTAAKTPAKQWEVDEASMPWKMQCDYVRVYQAEGEKQ